MRLFIIQLVDLYCLPRSINNLTISLQTTTYDNYILTSTPPPNSLKRLDGSDCLFLRSMFDLPQYLTHLTVSYPSLPRDTVKLPSTIKYLNISGYIPKNLHNTLNNPNNYSKGWINMFPDNAPFLRTLILHLYVSPKKLFPEIVRFADTLRYLDCRILLLNMIDIFICEKSCHLGKQIQLETIQELKNLVELKFHCRLEEKISSFFEETLVNKRI
jgi:hypothetical protein